MAKITVPENFDDIVEQEAIPPGAYLCIIQECEEGESKAGKPMISWRAEIDDPDVGEDLQGRSLFWYNVLSKAALWNLKRCLDAAGVPYEGDSFETQDALGAKIVLVVKADEFEGKPTAAVKDYLPANE